MRVRNFEGSNADLSGSEEGSNPEIPAYVNAAREIVTCWEVSFFERFVLLLTGKIWLTSCTFGSPIQPQLLEVGKPPMKEEAEEENETLTG